MERGEKIREKTFFNERQIEHAIREINVQYPNAKVCFHDLENFCDEMLIKDDKDLRKFFDNQKEGNEHLDEGIFFEILSHICKPRSPFLFRVIKRYLDLTGAERQ